MRDGLLLSGVTPQRVVSQLVHQIVGLSRQGRLQPLVVFRMRLFPFPQGHSRMGCNSSSVTACEFCIATREPNSTCERKDARNEPVSGRAAVSGSEVQLDESLPLGLGDLQATVDVDEVRNPPWSG